MTDLERAQVPSDKAMAFVRERQMKECRPDFCYSSGHGFCLCKGFALMLDDFAAEARREGAQSERAKWEEAYVKAQRHAREAGAEEMRERAVLAARGCLGVEIRGDGMSLSYLVTEAIRALPVTPEGLA